jgi:hypothetical protein
MQKCGSEKDLVQIQWNRVQYPRHLLVRIKIMFLYSKLLLCQRGFYINKIEQGPGIKPE